MGVNPRAPHVIALTTPFQLENFPNPMELTAQERARHRPVSGRETRKEEWRVRHPSVSSISSISFAS